VFVAVGVGVDVSVAVAVGVGVAVSVGVSVGVAVVVAVGVSLGVALGPDVAVSVLVGVGVAVAVAVLVGVAVPRDEPDGREPPLPPGSKPRQLSRTWSRLKIPCWKRTRYQPQIQACSVVQEPANEPPA
jgi:hypothetical protein